MTNQSSIKTELSKRERLASECSKLDSLEEQILADEGLIMALVADVYELVDSGSN